MSVTQTDVLVVGAGIAGQLAALQAARRGKSVVILSKVQPFLSHSRLPEGGVNVSFKTRRVLRVRPEDSTTLDEGLRADDWRQQAEDIWNDGFFLSDWDALETTCREAPEIIRNEFYNLLDKDDRGEVLAYDHAGTPRSLKAGARTGLNFIRKLLKDLAQHNVQISSDRFVSSLVVESGACLGATAFNLVTGEIEGYAASSVILCAGGFGYLYENTLHDSSMTGDGQALAYQAGVPLKDMEFVRFHHFVLYGSHYAVTEGAFRKGCELYNKDHERFLKKYDPDLMEGCEAFHLKKYIQMEIDSGMAVDGKYVWAKFTHLGEDRINKTLPRTRKGCLNAMNLDPAHDLLPVTPGVFATLGGIAIDVDGRTNLPGLYAAGECACAGLHGADWRLGNTLLAAVVFGTKAGIAAVEDRGHGDDKGVSQSVHSVSRAVENEVERLNEIASRQDGEPYEILLGTLRRTMTRDVTVSRDRQGLERALATIRDLQNRYPRAVLADRSMQFNRQLVDYLGLGHMLLLGEAVANAAMARTESRGAHWRTDFPQRDDRKWLCHSVQRASPSGPELTYMPVQLGEFRPRETVIIR